MTEQSNIRVFSIRETNARIRAIVEQETVGKLFWIGGMVRKHHVSDLGHEYFELYDDDYTIRCMLRESMRGNLPFSIANGAELEVYGAVRVYEKGARIEIEVENAHLIDSILPRLNEDVQSRLEKRNLWPKPERPLPETIHRIGLITSQHSEAKDDFYSNYYANGGKATIDLKDVRVQGEQAPREIADTIRWFNQQDGDNRVDVIVLTRGGGRNADLAVFSDFLVAEEMCRSQIPIGTGIGHESNETFADLAADISKSTPTAIAIHLAQSTKEGRSFTADVHQQAIRPQGTGEKAKNAASLLVVILLIVSLIIVITQVL